jgi:hypothetical protein
VLLLQLTMPCEGVSEQHCRQLLLLRHQDLCGVQRCTLRKNSDLARRAEVGLQHREVAQAGDQRGYRVLLRRQLQAIQAINGRLVESASQQVSLPS